MCARVSSKDLTLCTNTLGVIVRYLRRSSAHRRALAKEIQQQLPMVRNQYRWLHFTMLRQSVNPSINCPIDDCPRLLQELYNVVEAPNKECLFFFAEQTHTSGQSVRILASQQQLPHQDFLLLRSRFTAKILGPSPPSSSRNAAVIPWSSKDGDSTSLFCASQRCCSISNSIICLDSIMSSGEINSERRVGSYFVY